MSLKWGIAGAGRISHDFVRAASNYPGSEHVFIAVASRSKVNAEKFAKNYSIPKFYEDYPALAQDTEIDIVYVGNLCFQHFETAKLMLEHGKHVLCEKPFTLNEKQTKKLCQIARAKKLFLMEGIWTRFFPAVIEMKSMIDKGVIGEIMHVSANFGLEAMYNQRVSNKELRGSAILDLGIYILQLQQYVFRGLKAIKIKINGHLSEAGTDESFAAIITYPGGKMAIVSSSARVKLENQAIVVGTKGVLKMNNFWCPDELILPDGTVKEFPLPPSSVEFLRYHSSGLRYEAEEARACIRKGKIESSHMPLEESIELARLMDLMRKEINIVFPEDSQEF